MESNSADVHKFNFLIYFMLKSANFQCENEGKNIKLNQLVDTIYLTIPLHIKKLYQKNVTKIFLTFFRKIQLFFVIINFTNITSLGMNNSLNLF